MKKLSQRRKIAIFLIVLLSALSTILLFQISAASGSITVTPSTRTIAQGKTFTAVVTVDVDSPITVAQASISYDRNVLQLNDINYSGSPLSDNSPESSNNPGNLVLSRFKIGSPYPTGRFTLATLTFTARGSGATSIAVNSASSALYEATQQSANILTQVTGTSITITTPPPSNPTPSNPTEDPKPTTGTTTPTSNQPKQNTPDSIAQIPTATPSDEMDSPEANDAEPALILQEQPSDSLPQPGASIRATDPSLGQQLTQIGRNFAPVVILLVVAVPIGWLVAKRFGHHSSFGGYKPAQAAGPGVVFNGSRTIKTNQDSNTQPPSPIQ